MSTYRGPSADDHHHASPVPDDRKADTSTANVSVAEEPIATRKCCTLCNLLVSSILIFIFINTVYLSVSIGSSFTNTFTRYSS